MAYVGIDGHKKQSQMCLLTAAGAILRSASPRHGSSTRRSVRSATARISE